LKGRRVLITSAAAGISEVIVYRFAEAGADLELADIDEIGLQRVKEVTTYFDVEVNTHVVDSSNRSEISKLWEGLNGREPDILVNNAR